MEGYNNPYYASKTQKEEVSEARDYNATNMKVVGVGGAGCNAINRMIEDGIGNVHFIAANTDIQALHNNLAKDKLQLGARSTKGLGAGARPEVGEKAATEDIELIREHLQGADMVFITAGMGGGTGTGAAPVIAKVSKELGALTVAVVTLPFDFEMKKRYDVALEGIERLKEHVDTMLVISNSRIFEVIERRVHVKEAFKKIDDVLKQAVLGISSIISDTAIINVDFADVKTILSNKGEAIMGIGMASGEDRAIEAAKMALENPLIENSSFRHAGAMLIYIIGGVDFTMNEFDEAARTVSDYCRDGAEIITGLNIEENLKDKIKVIIVATDFQADAPSRRMEDPIAAEDIYERGKVIELSDVRPAKKKFTTYIHSEGQSFNNDAPVNDNDYDVPAYLRKRARRMG